MAEPSQLSDDELKKVIETGEEPESPEVPPAPEEPEAEIAEPEVPETPEAPEEPAQEQGEEQAPEEPPVSRREQLRVNDLLRKYGPPPSRAQQSGGIDYRTALEAEPEIISQLEQDRRVVSDQAYQQGINQAATISWRNTLKMEAPSVEKEFTFLNPRDTQNFRPAAADAMNNKYLRFIGYNPGDTSRGIPESVQIPDVSYREFVESEMEFVNELATRKVAESTKNIAKQTAQTGLRPDGSSAKRLNLNQDPSAMTNEELYAAIGQTPPKK